MNVTLDAGSSITHDARDRVLAACVFAFALGVCFLASGGDALGDEAFYLYLSRTFGHEPAAAADYAWFHVLNRPLYYAIYHLATYGGFVSFRWFSCALCAAVIALVFLLARRFGASQRTAVIGAAVLALTRSLFVYAAHGFPDVLASGFALLAVAAALQQRAAATALLSLACVLCKESFVALPFVATWVRWSGARARFHGAAWAWLGVLIPTGYVAAVTLIGASTPGIRLQGWSPTPLSLTHAHGMWVGPELWPLLVFLLARRQWQRLGLWLGLPLFYVLWSWVLGRGLSPWYVIGPAMLSAVVVPGAIDEAALAARARWGRWGGNLYVPLVLCLLPIAYSGVLRVAAELRDGMPRVQVAPDVVALLEKRKPERVLLVGCFWSYRYSHLRGPTQPAARMESPGEAELPRVIDAAHEAQVTIMCRTPETRARGIEQRLAASGFDTLLVSEDYWVLQPKS